MTMRGQTRVSNATGFFFRREERLFLVTSRHVVLDEASQHRPDRLQIEPCMSTRTWYADILLTLT
jgi:hypothetical protein